MRRELFCCQDDLDRVTVSRLAREAERLQANENS